MPTVRVTQSIAFGDDRCYRAGETVALTGDQAQEAVASGWGELVREQRAETPEGSRARRQNRPERRG